MKARATRSGMVALALCVVAVPASGQTPGSAPADSTLEEWIDALPEGVDADDARDALEDAASRRPPRGTLALVTGARRDARLRAGWGGWTGVGRLSETSAGKVWGGGGVAWRGQGWLEAIVLGRVRPRLAEGALVGVRASDYAPPRAAAGPAGLVLRPSATGTAALTGGGAALRAGGWRAAVGAWEPVGAEASPTGWGSLARVRSWGSAGAAFGWVGGVGVRTPAGAVFASRGDGTVGGAAEAAWLGGRETLVLRAWSGGDTGPEWWVEAFADGGGAAFGTSVVGPGDFRGRRTGAAWHRAVRRGRMTGRLSVCAVSRARTQDRRRRLRAQWEGRLAGAPGAQLDWLLRLDDERTLAYTANGDPPDAGASRHARARVRLTVAEGAAAQRFELAVQGPVGARPGAVVGWRGTIALSILEATVAATAWALPAGETGYYARPGTTGYEILGVATRRGSDYSARLTCRLGRAAVTCYAGGRDGAEARWLVSVDLQA